MNRSATFLQIPLLEERLKQPFLLSVALHFAILAFAILAPYLVPQGKTIIFGSGPGGGRGGEAMHVGLVDELAGGTGMTKPSLIPQPPADLAEKPKVEEPKPEAIELPRTLEAKKEKPKPQDLATAPDKAATKKHPDPVPSNVIPTPPKPGAGGTGGAAGGGGGGFGGGSGVSIGAGSGGLGDFWYARLVENRIGSNWVRPLPGTNVEIIYSFNISDEGVIYNVKKEKSSGNELLDMTAERAIRASTPLTPLPPALRGRHVQFVSQFAFPPNP